MNEEKRDMNRDPISKEPGSASCRHGCRLSGRSRGGRGARKPFGPIGMLVGGAIGAIAGGAAGHAAGEAIDPTGEGEYWKHEYATRPYYDKSSSWDDYEPAYRYGWESRSKHRDRSWDDSLENDLRTGWESAKGKSQMTWDRARDAVRDSWDRTDRTYRTYGTADDTWRNHYQGSEFFDKAYDYDRDFRPAYRYGAFSRSRFGDRAWDDSLENELERDWNRTKGASRLTWDKAKQATRHAWHNVERAIPGDADRDGR